MKPQTTGSRWRGLTVLLCCSLGVGNAGAAAVAAGCPPPAHKAFTLETGVLLACNPSGERATSATVFDIPLSDRGSALARARLKLRHTGASDVIHFWNAQIAVGDEEYAMGIGDDLCPGSGPVIRSNLGYGKLSAGRDRVRLYAHQGSAPCTDGSLEIMAGSTLDVWIEDGTCPKPQVIYASHYRQVGFTDTYVWRTHLSPVVQLQYSSASVETLLVMSVAEGSPDRNPNQRCGEEVATLSTQLRLDEAVADETTQILPASQGMGHLVLDSEAERRIGPGDHLVELRVRADFESSQVRTGGCCGDAAIFLVRGPHRNP